MSELKKCSKCGQELPATNEYFYRNKAAKDGFQNYCKECVKANGKKKSSSIIEMPIVSNKSADNCLINIEVQNGGLTVSSREVAEKFKKQHSHVMEAVRNLMVENSTVKNLFIPSIFKKRGKEYPEYQITRDGFSLLAMGFTGSKALEWKLKFIEAFNKMEEALNKQPMPTGKQLLAMALIEADATIKEQASLIGTLQKKIEDDAPLVRFANQLAESEEDMSIDLFAKALCDEGFEIGEKRLFRWLRNNKYLTKKNIPYQQYLTMKVFKVKFVPYKRDGRYHKHPKPLITPKGARYLFNKILADETLRLSA